MAKRLRHTAPVVRRATRLHHPLDRLRLLLYILPKRCPIQPLALTHLTDTDTLGKELWRGESPLQHSSRSLRSLGTG